MSRLLACPFCRDIYDPGEIEICPSCDLHLRPLKDLPQSPERQIAAQIRWELGEPDDATRSLWDVRDGRGPLVLVAAMSLVCFFVAPWLHITKPYDSIRTGADLAGGRLGWLWGGAVAWGVEAVLVFTRRNAHAMRGVRIISTLFCSMTLAEGAILLLLPPTPAGPVPFVYQWQWGLFGGMALSVIGCGVSLRFGGKPQIRRVTTLAQVLSSTPPQLPGERESESAPTIH